MHFKAKIFGALPPNSNMNRSVASFRCSEDMHRVSTQPHRVRFGVPTPPNNLAFLLASCTTISWKTSCWVSVCTRVKASQNYGVSSIRVVRVSGISGFRVFSGFSGFRVFSGFRFSFGFRFSCSPAAQGLCLEGQTQSYQQHVPKPPGHHGGSLHLVPLVRSKPQRC